MPCRQSPLPFGLRWLAVCLAASLVLAGLPAAGRGQVPQALIGRVPSVSETRHSGTFGGIDVRYRAIVEEHVLSGPDGTPNATLVTIAYVREGAPDAARRPVTFAFNGGPGASSSPLHMDGLGPRLRTRDGTVPNPHSLLDVTDLVFIDPVGTGFSRPYTTEAGRAFYWSRTGDAKSVWTVIQRWLAKHGREGSPRYVVGESYGASRVGLIYQHTPGARFDGVVLVATPGEGGIVGREMPFVVTLPTMATSAWYWDKVPRNGRSVEAVYREAVEFARGPYLTALVKGTSLPADERRRVVDRLSALVGLPAVYIEEKNLRLTRDDWMLSILKDRNLRTGMLDTRVTAPRDTMRTGGLADPALGGGTMRIGTALLAPAIVPGTAPDSATTARVPSVLERYLVHDLGFRTLEAYRSLNLDINGVWNHEDRSDPNVALAQAMRADPKLRVFWTGGFYDLTTPAYGTQYSFDQVGLVRERTSAMLLAGAHGVFADEANRAVLARALREWIR